ncbi:GNAT family N-acetyltransferase [Tessaracoccus caeni]|uniref:GNAT family N-acetyltransferase n=1 Tax=Tessaracoccus caeni TaxID=3031239 RepID=UPI0023DA6C41|nr:GNAT family N-acetyltransferase [Tessaracoccus caeni]MDF1487635.1 GNAT family N-acetyltransferase [Tessaracoccus caeni]
MSLRIRRACEDDLPAITRIYNEAGVNTTASWRLQPVTVADRREWFQRQQADNFPVLVIEVDGEVAGFASYGTFRSLEGYRFTVEHSIYLSEQYRAAGAGRSLMRALMDVARGQGIHVMVGVVDGDNEQSLRFHESLGFVEAGRLNQIGHKFGRWLDCVFMTYIFEGPQSDPSGEPVR